MANTKTHCYRAVSVTYGFIWLIVGLGLLLPLTSLTQAANPALFTASDPPQAITEPVNPEIVIRQRLVDVQVEQFDETDGSLDNLKLNLFEDVIVEAVQEHLEITIPQDDANAPIYTWIGYVKDVRESQVTLVYQEQRLSGTIDLPDASFHIRNSDDGQHVIRELLPTPSPPESSVPPLVAEAVNHSRALEREVFELTNRERQTRGHRPLAWNNQLATAARRHARDMADRNFHSHTGSDGSSAGDRMTQAGYAWNRGGEWWENIAAWSAPETAQAVVNRWMNSSGHRASILRTTICDLGVGHAGNARSIGSRYDTYWTQNFGRLSNVNTGQCRGGDDDSDDDDPDDDRPNTIDIRYYYRLTNAFLGRGRALDTYSDTHEPFMARSRNVTGQYWRLTPLGNDYYRLTNMFLGTGRSLDTYSDTHEPFMARSRNATGQYWKLTPLGNGQYRLTNRFLGKGRSLDTYRNTHEPFMGRSRNVSGQKWRLEKLSRIR